MELIRKIKSKLSKSGKLEQWAIFLCPFCLQEVKRRLDSGKKCKSCGCQRNKLIGLANKGKKRTEEQNKRNSEANKGKNILQETREKIREANAGKKRTEETRQKMRESQKGKKASEETRQKMSKAQTGENNPMYGSHRLGEFAPAYGLHRFGELSPNWQGGKSFEEYPQEFKLIRKSILERDNYKCQCPDCKHLSIKLNVHHIDFDKQNNDPENLITLCCSCHIKTNSKNNRQYWIEYYQKILNNIQINLI